MKISIQEKLDSLIKHHEDISQSLSDPKIINDQNQFRALSKEYAQLEPVVNCYRQYKDALVSQTNAKELLDDPEMAEMAKEELKEAEQRLINLEEELQILLLPQDPNDANNTFLEVRAGTGGDEAAIFAGDLFRMYARYAERKGWKFEIINEHEGEHGGYKEVIARVIGNEVYSHLKFESGAHRVQRVPATESQGRIHTSACTVAVIPEAEQIDEIEINPSDLRIDTYRASGAGGQHVNKTDSAIRITHIPTGVVVECQDERSQHKNRARALSLLQSRLLAAEREKQRSEQAETRRNLVGSGDRSERIRTYNYPQARITDHRINLTLYKLAAIMEGDLDELIENLIREHRADQLAALGEE